MTIRRYGVLDASGVKVNTILVDEAVVGAYWPGYGARLIDEGLAPAELQPPAPPAKDKDFAVLPFVFAAGEVAVGDTVDFKTGAITKHLAEELIA